jgi:hypothetical protein
MFFERKTKPKNALRMIAFPLLAILSWLVTMALAGPGPAFYLLGGIYLLVIPFPFIIFLRTRNSGYLAVTGFILTSCLMMISAPAAIADKSSPGLTPLFLAFTYILMLVVGYQAINRKLRWRGEEVFELAALPVEDIGDSFSARPRPAGRVPVSKTEMIRFVEFMTKNLIAFAFREENRVVFVLTLPGNDLPYLLGIKKDYIEDTWVAIDYDGNITVNITEEDYLLFKMDLDFDQLCQSLGDLFREFLELSKQGQDSRIIDRMNALRLFPIN